MSRDSSFRLLLIEMAPLVTRLLGLGLIGRMTSLDQAACGHEMARPHGAVRPMPLWDKRHPRTSMAAMAINRPPDTSHAVPSKLQKSNRLQRRSAAFKGGHFALFFVPTHARSWALRAPGRGWCGGRINFYGLAIFESIFPTAQPVIFMADNVRLNRLQVCRHLRADLSKYPTN